jgi:hypothetical protein
MMRRELRLAIASDHLDYMAVIVRPCSTVILGHGLYQFCWPAGKFCVK